MNLLPHILLADIGEVIGAAVGLIALVLWVIQRIAEASKAMRPQPARGADGPMEAELQPAGQQPVGQQADPLRNQVEEFLRRAGGQQGNQGGGPQRRMSPSQDVEVLLGEESLSERRLPSSQLRPAGQRPAARSTAPKQPAPSDQRPARRSVVPKKRKSLAERADERSAARAKNLERQVSSLGKRVIEEDQQFDTELKAKFDHTVGTLADQTTVSPVELTPAEPSSSAVQIAAMLANPDGVRQAIILNEILNRPSDRW
jgi:hypothetical protein